MSKIRWPLISWNKMGTFPFLSSSGVNPYFSWNVYRTFNISFSIDLLKKSVPVSLYICSASYTIFRTRIPYLWEFFQYFLATFPMMWSRFFSTSFSHQWNAGFRSILLLISYYTNSIRFEAFRSFSGTQDVDPYFYYTCRFHPSMVLLSKLFPFIYLMNPSLI